MTGGNVVNKYSPEAALAGSSTPEGQLSGFNYAFGVAVDPSSGDVYVTDVQGTVEKFSAAGDPSSLIQRVRHLDWANP